MLPVALFNSFVTSNNLFNAQSKVLAAVSGGMDSVFMVHLLHAAGYNLAIAHCNFQLRGDEALQDEHFCRQLAKNLGVPFYNISFETDVYAAKNKISIQMAARDLRYQWFDQIRLQNGYDVIAIAHHQNDTIETILLNLTRGTGIAGLHGIRPKNGSIVRPLLFMTREEIAHSVAANNISYREDSSNSSIKYARNKLRHQVVPALKELNPHLEHTFAAAAKHFAELEQLLQLQLSLLKETLFTYQEDDILLEIFKVKDLQPLHLLLYGLLEPYRFSATTVADIISALGKHPGRVFESPAYQLVLDREHLIITAVNGSPSAPVQLTQADTQGLFGRSRIDISTAGTNFNITNSVNTAALDADKLGYPLAIRSWQKGDNFYPLGMKTRKKLSDFFISLKIPLHQKEQIPLLINGNGDIIWVCGYRVDDRYKITPATKKIAIFELTEF